MTPVHVQKKLHSGIDIACTKLLSIESQPCELVTCCIRQVLNHCGDCGHHEILGPAQRAVNPTSHCCAGLLKTLGANKNAPLPVRLFEISDVVLLSDKAETGARNERRLAAAVCAKENTFETIHGFLNRVMDVLGVPAHVPGLGETPHDCDATPRRAQQKC